SLGARRPVVAAAIRLVDGIDSLLLGRDLVAPARDIGRHVGGPGRGLGPLAGGVILVCAHATAGGVDDNTPLARAAATARFMACASSPTRRVAPRHQCWSHMSQMMIAVFVGSQRRCSSLVANPEEEPFVALPEAARGTRTRACRVIGSCAGGPPPPRPCGVRQSATPIVPRIPTALAERDFGICTILPDRGILDAEVV